MKGLLGCAFALWMLPGGPASAADGAGNYAVWGVGHASCNQYAIAYEKKSIQDYRSYLAGYLTAVNTISAGTFQATGQNSADDNLSALYQHCSVNRMSSFESAIQALLQQTDAARRKVEREKDVTWGRPPPPGEAAPSP